MLVTAGLNILAIVVAWLFNVIVGALWYSPVGFGKQWEKYTGIDIMKMPKNEANKSIGYVAVACAVMATVLAIVVKSMGVSTIPNALILGAVLWAGLQGATTVGNTFYSRHNWGYWALNTSYYLLVFVVNCVIFALWK